MNEILLATIITLSSVGLLAAIILYFVAQRFKVYEDPRINLVEEALPAANCGGCGYTGCRNFAEAMINAESLDDFYCPVGGNDTMVIVANLLGYDASDKEAEVAVVRCSGTPEHRPRTTMYDGAPTCVISHTLYIGESGCSYGCLGLGDCVVSCDFDAIYMNESTGLPEIIDEKCTACGACVKACPRMIIELRKRHKKDRKIYVSCINEEKGSVARKSCEVVCIGCGKCVKVCTYDAITMENNLAFIDSYKCKLCRKCAPECPTYSILEINFPPKKEKPADKEPAKPTSSVEKETSKQDADKTSNDN